MATQMTMLDKLNLATPYNIFYNTIPELPETSEQTNSIAFTGLLCPSLGKLKCSLQITSKVDIKWLMQQYESRDHGTKPLTLLFGENKPEMEEYIVKNLPNVTHYCVGVNDQYGNHHAKMGIYVYEDNSLRVVVSTSNLYEYHWNKFNHSFWVSPLCPPLVEKSPSGDSPTNFKNDLLTYLKQYNLPSILNVWIDYVKRADFRDVRVFLVTSFPGHHGPGNLGSHLQHMERVLKKHCRLSEQVSWPIVIQTSCIGQFGETPENWVRSMFLKGLSGCVGWHCNTCQTPFYMIYPTVKNVQNGLFGVESGQGLKYLDTVHATQGWVQRHLHQWKADGWGRTLVMPHAKIYCRMSPCCKKMAWFLLTSANATRGAWGQKKYFFNGVYMRNYEVGVLFLPEFFGEEDFRIGKSSGNGEKMFPMLFDLPLTKYEDDDKPWTNHQVDNITQKVTHSFGALHIR